MILNQSLIKEHNRILYIFVHNFFRCCLCESFDLILWFHRFHSFSLTHRSLTLTHCLLRGILWVMQTHTENPQKRPTFSEYLHLQISYWLSTATCVSHTDHLAHESYELHLTNVFKWWKAVHFVHLSFASPDQGVSAWWEFVDKHYTQKFARFKELHNSYIMCCSTCTSDITLVWIYWTYIFLQYIIFSSQEENEQGTLS